MPILNLGIPQSQYPMDWVDSRSGRCIVAASAACIWNDLRQVNQRAQVVCVNDMAMHFPGPVNHLYSNNDRWLDRWKAGRRDQYVKRFGEVEVTHSNITGGQVTWPWPGAGTSSLGAVYTALALGYEEITLVGIPLDDSPHYFEAPWVTSTFSKQVPPKGDGRIKYWADAAANVFDGRVKAISGRLKDIL